MTVEAGAPSGTAQKVFICYRREETAPYAGRIYDAMVARFGVDNVFMDLDLAPGVDFVDRITKVVSGCVALIVVIGPKWAKLQSEDGTRRIEDPDDFVRLEIETGLRRHDVTPIPVLVGGARMPRREDLPPELQAITRRNALEISEGRWAYDVGRLLKTLEELLPGAAGPVAPSPPPQPRPRTPTPRGEGAAHGWRTVLEGMVVAGVTAAAARGLGELIPFDSKAKAEEEFSEVAEHIANIVLTRAETLALVGAALTVWLAVRVWRSNPLLHLMRGLLVGALAGLLGGALWGLAVYLPEHKLSFDAKAQVELAGIAVSGGILGSLIGWLWHPRRTGPGFIGGALAGLLFQLLVVIAAGWENQEQAEVILSFGIATALIAGGALLAMVASDRSETRYDSKPD